MLWPTVACPLLWPNSDRNTHRQHDPVAAPLALIEAKRPVHILDMMEQEVYRAGDAIDRATR